MKRYLLFFSCIILYHLGLFAQTDEDKEMQMSEHFNKAFQFSLIQKDTAFKYYNTALELAVELGDYEAQLDILDFKYSTSDYHYDLTTSLEVLEHIHALLNKNSVRNQLENFEEYWTAYLLNQGNYYYKTKEFEKAEPFFQKLLKQYDGYIADLSEDEAENLLITNNFLGVIYKHTGKYELSEQYFLKNRVLAHNNKHLTPNKEAYLTSVNILLAQLYGELNHPEKAIKLLADGVTTYKAFYKKDKKFKNNLINVYQQVTENYIRQDSLQPALRYLEESKTLLKLGDPFYKESLLLYGDIYTKLAQPQKALDQYSSALKIFEDYRQYRPHQDIAEVYGKIAELWLKQKNYKEGLKTIQKAFNAVGNNIQITDFNQNPDPGAVFSKTQLLHLLDVKLQLLQGSFEETANTVYQDAILQTSRDILSTFDLLKSEFDSKLDKQFLADKAYPIFHRLLETAHKAYEKGPSDEILQLALNIAEKNKDFVLLEALRNAQASQYGNVPQKVLEKEAQLRAEITNLEKELFDASETESSFSDALFKRKQEYFGFLDTLKSKYPKYHELKYQNRTLDLTTIRDKVLDNNGTLISYTMADDHLFAIVINGSKTDFLKLPFDEADREAIRKFYRLLSRPSINNAEKEITEIGRRLFEKILKQPLANFKTENLTILPDGELHYLPFDLLQESGSYLLETTNISYGNSVTSLLELKEKGSAETNKILAFAPSFSGAVIANTDRLFGKLLYNDDEVQKIGAFYDTETVIDDQATLENFKSKTSNYNVLHLATHASANDKYPDYSYLAFTQTKDTTEGNILYIKDLYNMSLNADMVTLSACQTGIGKLQKGQGMLSLSKGFYYAGAKSLVTTLWKINDKSTVKLMQFFYEGLSKGKSKKEALRSAKLKYLETTDDSLLKHPYYWAAFTVSGDASPISNDNSHWWWLLGISLFGICIWWIKRTFQSN